MIGAAISLAADIGSMAANSLKQSKFDEMKRGLIGSIQGVFKDLYAIFDDDTRLFETFAPQIAEIEMQIANAEKHLESYRNTEKYCKDLRDKLLTFWEEPEC